MRTRTWFLFASIPPWCASSGRAAAFSFLLFGGNATPTQPTKVGSIGSVGVQRIDVCGRSAGPAIHGNSQIAAFVSQASALVLGETNPKTDNFVHDRTTGVTERVIVRSSGNRANLSATLASIRADGRWVMLSSRPVRRVHPRL